MFFWKLNFYLLFVAFIFIIRFSMCHREHNKNVTTLIHKHSCKKFNFHKMSHGQFHCERKCVFFFVVFGKLISNIGQGYTIIQKKKYIYCWFDWFFQTNQQCNKLAFQFSKLISFCLRFMGKGIELLKENVL